MTGTVGDIIRGAMAYAEYWDVEHPAIWPEHAPDGHTIMLRHPSYPYEGPTDGTIPNDRSATLINFAAGYLRKVSAILGLPGILEAADPDHPDVLTFVSTSALTWLPLHEGETPAPLGRSFWVRRYVHPERPANLVDRTAIILAVQTMAPNEPERILGSRLGIRIIVHVAGGPANRLKARITGVSVSAALKGAPRPDVAPASTFLQIFMGERGTQRDNLEDRIRAIAALASGRALFLDGLRVVTGAGTRALIDVHLNVPATDKPDSIPLRVTMRFGIVQTGGPDTLRARITNVEKLPLIADAGPVKARVFPRDPASQAGLSDLIDARPSRAPDRLMKYWKTRILPGLASGPFGETPLTHGGIDVMQSKWVDTTANETQQEVICPCCVRQPRMNWAAAVNGYWHAHGLFATMLAYGLPPHQYFKLAALPVRIRYRAGINPGPGKDGKVVNARVTYDPPDCDLVAFNGTLKPLQVKFALADLKRSLSRREPLGLAGDPRWSWHEYGHVLLGASTGALQLHFVHSVGDTLAAILWDPTSELATHERMRGLTFPWAYLHRHHDRDVFLGWSWSGRYHRALRFPDDGDTCRRKGYQSEQILSTSLFRLYRSLGGETALQDGTPPHPRRREAAAYTTYLIMKAIDTLGPASLTPVETPDELVSALIDADIGTLPVASGPLAHRVGGYAHKVIRWAFEMQGLYTGAAPEDVVDTPGQPVDPDVFIEDLRPDSPGDAPRGGYMPVSLDWEPVPDPDDLPLWHADPDAISVSDDEVEVQVQVRSAATVDEVWVEVWWIDWPDAQPEPPAWDRTTWTSLGSSGPLPVDPGTPTTFSLTGLPTAPSDRRLLILAAATCTGDPANIDTSTALPCSSLPTPIVDLVAGDNNLGLRLHIIP